MFHSILVNDPRISYRVVPHMRGSLHLLSNYRPYLVWSLYRRPLSCRGNMAFSLPYFDVRFVGAILVNARPKRNISATIVADVKRFSHQINTDEVFGTHSGPSLSRNIYSVTFRGAFGNEPLRLRVERAGAPDQSHKLKRRCM